MRYAVYGRTDSGIEDNFFENKRTYSQKKNAIRAMERLTWVPITLFIKEVPSPITDLECLNWLMCRSSLGVWDGVRVVPLKDIKDPRDRRKIIEQAILEERSR